MPLFFRSFRPGRAEALLLGCLVWHFKVTFIGLPCVLGAGRFLGNGWRYGRPIISGQPLSQAPLEVSGMASMSHPPLYYGLLHPRPGRWIKGRPRAVAPGAVILQHHFFGASALAPYGGHWHPPGPFYQIGGWAIPFHTGPNLFGAPLQNQQGNGHFMYSPAPPRQAGPGPLKYNGLPRGDITREAFIYHPRPKNHQVGEWYTHYAGRLVSTA